ncbi:DUF3500 domain-containing protein [uncultured Pseudoteredinibacter sp.]|uniref:DUF3500 domain-containing protein n=1 Tax=uncultured Pseudoteredinibacter sp. TaxID=1641701 RepID=UPI00262279D8|nr:DUF3500 domain-containing protein [uncultured Pseudoteredinibacter sp.]
MRKYASIFAVCLASSTPFVYGHGNVLDHSHPSSSASQMTAAGTNFVKSLSDEQRKSMILNFKNDKERTYWTNAPVDSQSRNGLPIGRLSIEQRFLLHDLLMASTSSQGYQKIWAAVRGDDELKREGENRELKSTKFFTKNRSLGAMDYWVSFYGSPLKDKSWSYMITGHHLAANFTIVDGKVTFVPMFYGSDPDRISQGAHAGHKFLAQERNRGYEFLASLSPKQQKVAIVADEYPKNKFGAVDFAGPGKKDAKREYRGISWSQLDDVQKQLFWQLVKEYVENADFDVAQNQLDKIQHDGLEKLHFMWMGPKDGSEKVFFRVHGPSILIDFVDQRTGFDWNTHPHTIVRDPNNDYGQNWLSRHIEEFHK